MKLARTLVLLVCTLLLVGPAQAQHRKSPQTHHYKSSQSHRYKSTGPNYGDGKHTTSHGGHYEGATNAHHKAGHYSNPKTNNNYGKRKL